MKFRRKLAFNTISIFLMVSCVYLTVAVVLQININKLKKNEIIKNEERLLTVEEDVISYRISKVISDALYISDSISVHDLDTGDFKTVENEWKSFSDRKMIYDQIRYIDVDGNEKIRINYSQNGSVVVDKQGLQNKKDYYYFKDSIGLKRNETYISKIDLNVENGKVEQPIKPMLRFCTPVFGEDGKVKGIVVLNYYAENTLKQFEDVGLTSYGHMYLLNANGYWIYNDEDKSKEWTFMYEDKKNVSFKNEFPKEWNIKNGNKKGSFATEKGYYSYFDMSPNNVSLFDGGKTEDDSIIPGEGNWTAISFIPKDKEIELMIFTDIFSNTVYILKNHIIMFIIIFIVSLTFAIMIMMDKISKDKIKYFAEYDTATGTLNRRAGFEMLKKTYQYFMDSKKNVSVCFCDINGLKEVNDNLGHEAGDELILSVVNTIKRNIRTKDYVIRLGGDEFLIIFVDSGMEESENIWSRIQDEFTKINEDENKKYIISVSHGIEEFKFNKVEYIDEIINMADEKMYSEKREIKKNFKVLKKY